MSEHTKGRWEHRKTGVNLHEIYSSDGKSIATCWDIDEGLDSEANARHIVHCVNNMPKVLEALRKVTNPDWNDMEPVDDDLGQARALLASLESEKGGVL